MRNLLSIQNMFVKQVNIVSKTCTLHYEKFYEITKQNALAWEMNK